MEHANTNEQALTSGHGHAETTEQSHSSDKRSIDMLCRGFVNWEELVRDARSNRHEMSWR
jgi:hypothetical protein